MKFPTLFILGASVLLTACNDNQAHRPRFGQVWQWHDLWEPGDVQNDDRNVIGIIDENGYLYGHLRERLGRMETVGAIKKDGQTVGYIRDNLDVYDTKRRLVGYVDKAGYIFDKTGKLNGKLHEDDYTSSLINFSERPGLRGPIAHPQKGRLDFINEVYDYDNKKIGIVTYVPEETDYQAIPVTHPDDRIITRTRAYGAVMLVDYDKAALRHKQARQTYAYLCRFAYVENKREVYNYEKKKLGYLDRRDGFHDRNVYDLKHHFVGYISYGGTDLSHTDINLYDAQDRAIGRIPYGFEASGARMLLDDPNNDHIPWDGFETCYGGQIEQNNHFYDSNETPLGSLDKNLNVLNVNNIVIGHIGADGTLFDENDKIIAKKAGHKGDTGEIYKGSLSRFEEAHKIFRVWQGRLREAAAQKARAEKAREEKLRAEKAREAQKLHDQQIRAQKAEAVRVHNKKPPKGK